MTGRRPAPATGPSLFGDITQQKHVCTAACTYDFHPTPAPNTPRGRTRQYVSSCADCGRGWVLHEGERCPIERWGYAPGHGPQADGAAA